MVIDRQTQKLQKNNLFIKLLMKCVACCMYCLEKTLKFITNYCYIYVALQGSGFCIACKHTFQLMFAFPAQVAINAFVQNVLRLLQTVFIPLVCAWGCYEL